GLALGMPELEDPAIPVEGFLEVADLERDMVDPDEPRHVLRVAPRGFLPEAKPARPLHSLPPVAASDRSSPSRLRLRRDSNPFAGGRRALRRPARARRGCRSRRAARCSYP